MTTFPDGPEATDADRIRALVEGALRDSLGLDHSDVEIMRHVAGMSFTRGAYREAMNSYASIVLLEPGNVEAQIGLSESALNAEAFDTSLHAASMAILMTPLDPRGFLLSGRACLELGMAAEGYDDLRRAMSLAAAGGNASVGAEAERWLARTSPADAGAAPAIAAQ